MQPLTIVEGIAAPLPAGNIDTDVIMPKAFLKGVDRSGLKLGIFHELRFDPAGTPRKDFILNKREWADASFLIVGPNFGCGSSREHAVWGLSQLGIRALIGTSYAGIFFDNCARNGLLAISLEAEQIAQLVALAADPSRNRLTIDLPSQIVSSAAGQMRFEIDSTLKAALVDGLDAIGETLRERGAILAFEQEYFTERPWLTY